LVETKFFPSIFREDIPVLNKIYQLLSPSLSCGLGIKTIYRCKAMMAL
jgi:hypothetical protein